LPHPAAARSGRLEQTCEESHNEPMSAVAHLWVCNSLTGDIELDGPEGYAATTFEGSMTLWRGFCEEDPCWFRVESIELEAPTFGQSGYYGRDMNASLAYMGVGPYVDGDEGSIARGMFGLDVEVYGKTPSTSWTQYAFPMANSDTAVFAVPANGQIQIVDAYFAWDDHEVTITSEVASCYCATCT